MTESSVPVHLYEDVDLGGRDFAHADLRRVCFKNVNLRGCDFRDADLRSVAFLKCDLQGARLDGATFGANRFHGSCFAGATGLDPETARYVIARGGSITYTIAQEWPPETD